jgi:hypothetical protein
MNNKLAKKKRLIEHRKERYNHAIQRYIDGEVPYSYVEERWNKLKEIDK